MIDVSELAPPASPPLSTPQLPDSAAADPARERKRARDRERRANKTKRKRRRDAGVPRGPRGDVPPVPGIETVPPSLRGRPPRDKGPKRPAAAEVEEPIGDQIVAALAMLNTGFLAVVPCTCVGVPESLRGVVHMETCARMWALDDQEIVSLAAALGAELEAHPAWLASVGARLASWTPHVALAMAMFGVASARAQRRPGSIVVAGALTPAQQNDLTAWAAGETPPEHESNADEFRRVPRPEPEREAWEGAPA